MPKKITLTQVQKLAAQLSAEDRLELFGYLAKIPGSTLIYYPPVSEPRSMVLPSDHTQTVLTLNTELGWAIHEDGSHSYSVEGAEVIRIKFSSPNYTEANFQKLKGKALQITAPIGALRDKLRESIQQYLQRQGLTASEQEIDRIETAALQQYADQKLREELEKLAHNIDEHLAEVGIAILAKIVQTSGFAVANLLRDSLRIPEKKIKASDAQSIIYKPEWDRLKTIVGLQSTHGGARNVKHDWTPDELDCLAKNYEELSPIWREAKQIVRAAKKSQVASRRKNWRAEVLRAYPDLPSELVDRFQHLQADDAKPSDMALIHAKIKCGVVETYTPRELSDKIRTRKFKKKSRSSSKSTKARKLKSRS